MPLRLVLLPPSARTGPSDDMARSNRASNRHHCHARLPVGEGPMSSNHPTPRMGNRPHDPAYGLLSDSFKSTPKVKRNGCYICADMEFARMGLPLCNGCCKCSAKQGTTAGHIAADDGQCDDCGHDLCEACCKLPAQSDEICTCDTPCCEADVGVGIITCGSQHCPTHGIGE